jgi:hypothetical protein
MERGNTNAKHLARQRLGSGASFQLRHTPVAYTPNDARHSSHS